MDTFKISKPDNFLSVKINVDCTKPAITKIYEIVGGKRIKPYLLVSDEYENGSVDIDINKKLQWKVLAARPAADFEGHEIEIYTIIHHLPKSITTDEAVKEYILDPKNHINIQYWISDAKTPGDPEPFILNKTDKFELVAERTGIAYKYIKIAK